MGPRRAMIAILASSCLSATCLSASVDQETSTGVNPIRKVVNLLQAMQKKVTEEGEKEKELYDKFMCYCKHGNSDLQASISQADVKVPAVQTDIEASESKLAQTKEDLKQAQVDRTSAKDAMKEATALREQEAEAFAKEKSEYDTNIAAIEKAVAALEKGMAGSFLQTPAADTLRKLALGKQDLLDVDRQAIVSFLSNGYSPQSGEVTGILKEIGDEMKKSLADLTSTESAAIKAYDETMAAKQKEVNALSADIEAKTGQIGELGVSIVQMKEDLSDTEAALIADKKYLSELETSCDTKTSEWEERSKTRSEELVALADTIKVLNDDDALDLFKKTLPSPTSASLIQFQKSNARNRALNVVRTAMRSANKQDRVALDLISVALQGKRGNSQQGFEKVIKMIDEMVKVLKDEQNDDEHKKEYCNLQLDQGDDKRKALDRLAADKESAIDVATESIATLVEEISHLEAGIKSLDKSVAEATEQRKEENADFTSLVASNLAANKLLNVAKNRLNKFYNPALFKPPPNQTLTEQEQIFTNFGGTPPPTEAPGGIADTGVYAPALVEIKQHVSLHKDAPDAPPETWDAYSKKGEESTGVIAMVDLLIRDLEKGTTEAETEEKNSQKDYEALMTESAAKRAADIKSLAEKSGTKADLEAEVEAHKEEHRDTVAELMATEKYIASLHTECDWLLQYFEARKEARAGEIDSLARAKAVLSGADYSFVQKTSSMTERGHRGFLAA